MKLLEENIDNLIPIAWGNISEKAILNKIEKIKNKEGIEILCISNNNGKYYVVDGHHGVFGYNGLNRNPIVLVLENDHDLKIKYGKGAINTTNLNLLQERCYKFHQFFIEKGVSNFYELEKLTTK